MKDQKDVRVAIVGMGGMGKKYASLIDSRKIRGLCLAAVVGRSRTSQEWAAENLGNGAAVYPDEDALYACADTFDAVLITTPHRLHPDMTVRAFRAGKHVFCEKPAGVTLSDARRMSQAAEEARRMAASPSCSSPSSLLRPPVYAMMFHQRTYPKHRRIREILESGRLGRISRVQLENSRFFRTAFYHRSGNWRSSWKGEGGGALINQGSHLLDFWQWLFGLPETVYADIPFGKYNDFSVDDEATILMDYPGKMTGTFILSTQEGSYLERLEIAGTKGRLLMENDELTISVYSQDTREYAGSAGCTERQQLTETVTRESFPPFTDAYDLMLQNFSDAIHHGAPLIAPGEEGEKSMALINAAYLSAWKGTKVSLPFDPEEYRRHLTAAAEQEGNDG